MPSFLWIDYRKHFLGGEEYRSIEPFIVEMVGAFDDIGQLNEYANSKTEADDNNNSDNEMNDVVLRHIECSLLKMIIPIQQESPTKKQALRQHLRRNSKIS